MTLTHTNPSPKSQDSNNLGRISGRQLLQQQQDYNQQSEQITNQTMFMDEFFSNQEYLNQNCMGGVEIKEGWSQIEGRHQQEVKEDSEYVDLVKELMSDSDDASKDPISNNLNRTPLQAQRERMAQIEADKLIYKQHIEDLKKQRTNGKQPGTNILPYGADFEMPEEEFQDFSNEFQVVQAKDKIRELPNMQAFRDTEEIKVPEELTTEHTVSQQKTNTQKAKKKKKQKPKLKLLDDDIPLPQIEIIRSQPIKTTPKNEQQKKLQAAAAAQKKEKQQEKAKQQPPKDMLPKKDPPLLQQKSEQISRIEQVRQTQTLYQQRESAQSVDRIAPTGLSFVSTKSSKGPNQPKESKNQASEQKESTSTKFDSAQKSKLKKPKGSKRQMESASQEKVIGLKTIGQNQRFKPVAGTNLPQKGNRSNGCGSASSSILRPPSEQAQLKKPIFQLKTNLADHEDGNSIWARLEPTQVPTVNKAETKKSTTSNSNSCSITQTDAQSSHGSTSNQGGNKNLNASLNKQNKPQVPISQSQQAAASTDPSIAVTSGTKKKKKKSKKASNANSIVIGANPEQLPNNLSSNPNLQSHLSTDVGSMHHHHQHHYRQDNPYELFQQASQDFFRRHFDQGGAGTHTPDGQYIYDGNSLAQHLFQLFQQKMMEGKGPVMNMYQEEEMKRQQEENEKAPEFLPSAEDEKFHEVVSAQVKQTVKTFERKLDSVRKEREAVIIMIESLVKELFENRETRSKNDRYWGPPVPVSVKQYGSQASQLAVDSSDVDLAVTGLKLGGDLEMLIREMRKLFDSLEARRDDGYLKKIEFIDSASVPLIKIQIDLQVIQEITRNKAALQAQKENDSNFVPEPFVLIDPAMVILHVDITFDDYSLSVLNNRNAPFQQSQDLNESNRSAAAQGEQQYFYLADNPQCSGTNPFTHPNLAYMGPYQQQMQRLAQQSCSLAITSVHKIKELQHQYADLRFIVLIIKKLLAKYNLHKPYSGGLNSYSIVLMTSTFLKKFGINHISALSQNLTEFLKFFGHYFNPTSHGLDGTKFFTLSQEQRSRNEHVYILDIQNVQNNTSKSAFRIYEIKKVFRDAYKEIIQKMLAFRQEADQKKKLEIKVIESLLD